MSQLKDAVHDQDHILGPTKTPLTLLEYGDYQCSHCAIAHLKIQRLKNEFPNEIRFVFRHFPLSQLHEYAFLAAMAAESASLQGKFWPMHNLLFENQGLIRPEAIREFAEDLNLNTVLFEEGLRDKDLAQKIKRDFMTGVRNGIVGTPSFFLGGMHFNGSLDPDTWQDLIRAA